MNWLGLYQSAGHLGVLVFFLISGFVIAHVATHDRRRAFAVKRALRIMPPLYVALLLMFLAAMWRDSFGGPQLVGNSTSDPGAFGAAALLLTKTIGAPEALSVIWSLIAEVVAYAAILVVMPWLRLRPALALLGFAAIINLATAWTFFASVESAQLIVYALYIGAGSALYLMIERGKLLVGAIAAASFMALFILWYEQLYPARVFAAPYDLWRSYMASFAIFGVAWIALRSIPAFLIFLGNVSYSLYLVHLPVGGVILGLASSRLPIDGAVVLAVAGSLGVAWLSYKVVEQPSQRLARSLLRGRSRSEQAAASVNPA